MPRFTWPLSQGFDPSGPKKLNEVVFDWKERESPESTFIAFRLLLPLRLIRSMVAKAFWLVVPRRRRFNGKRPAACAPEFRVDVLALSSCSLRIESDACRKRHRRSFEIRGFRRPGNEFRMPCEGPGFRLIQRPIWSGKFELHACTSAAPWRSRGRRVVSSRVSAGRPSPRDSYCSIGRPESRPGRSCAAPPTKTKQPAPGNEGGHGANLRRFSRPAGKRPRAKSFTRQHV